jgi:hypothetical protein
MEPRRRLADQQQLSRQLPRAARGGEGPAPECTAGAAIKNLLGIDVKPDAAFLERGGNDSHERG